MSESPMECEGPKPISWEDQLDELSMELSDRVVKAEMRMEGEVEELKKYAEKLEDETKKAAESETIREAIETAEDTSQRFNKTEERIRSSFTENNDRLRSLLNSMKERKERAERELETCAIEMSKASELAERENARKKKRDEDRQQAVLARKLKEEKKAMNEEAERQRQGEARARKEEKKKQEEEEAKKLMIAKEEDQNRKKTMMKEVGPKRFETRTFRQEKSLGPARRPLPSSQPLQTMQQLFFQPNFPPSVEQAHPFMNRIQQQPQNMPFVYMQPNTNPMSTTWRTVAHTGWTTASPTIAERIQFPSQAASRQRSPRKRENPMTLSRVHGTPPIFVKRQKKDPEEMKVIVEMTPEKRGRNGGER